MGLLNRGAATAVLLGVAVLAGCSDRKTETSQGDVAYTWEPSKADEMAGVRADEIAAAIRTRLGGDAPADIAPDLWKHVSVLYDAYGGMPLWMDTDGPNEARVTALLRAMADSHTDGLRPEEYPTGALGRAMLAVREAKPPTPEVFADADVLLSSAYLALAEDLLSGQTDPRKVTDSWHIDFKHEKLDSAVVRSLRADDLGRGIARMRPQDADYEALRQGLQQMRGIVSRGGWQPIPAGKALKVGDRDSAARLDALRARLAAEGIQVPADTSTVYNRALAAGVSAYQERHAIGVDGMLGEETLESLNIPADFRLGQIAANLERHRWMPRSLGDRYIIVNVPAFRLQAFDSGRVVNEMKVIVGQEYDGRSTPAFSDMMDHLVFRPYWNVTPTIQEKEIEPKIASDPGYMAANNYEWWNDGGTRRVRQTPGPQNSLGLVKFMFPNSYNIYLHDTPSRSLFDKDVRAFSHGCIRVEKPAELAQWLLGWDAARVEDAMQNGSDNRTVKLPQKVPVYIAYFTAYAKDGVLHFGNDLYNRDQDLVKVMAPGAMPSAQALRNLEALRQLVKS